MFLVLLHHIAASLPLPQIFGYASPVFQSSKPNFPFDIILFEKELSNYKL